MSYKKIEPKLNRIPELEGLRGIAAIVVVLYHACLFFYPSIFFGPCAYRATHGIHFENSLYGQPFMGLIYGTFSVSIFFILSGFVLSVGYFKTGDETIVKKLAAKRYFRLMIPALVSILITWFILAIGLAVFKQHAQNITQSDWLIGMWNMVPNFSTALWQGLMGIFQGDVTYNPVLWTMKFELIGSFMVFGSLMLFGKNKYRWILYLGLFFGFCGSNFQGFVLGMILADLYAHNKFPFAGINKTIMLIFTIFAVMLGGYIPGVGIYRFISINWLNPEQNAVFFLTIAAAVVIVGVITVDGLRKLFSNRFVSNLGKYTFSLYLIHKAVLFTVCAGLFSFGIHHLGLGYNKAAVLSFIITLPILALVVYWFEKYVDAPAIRVSGRFSHFILGLPQKSTDTASSSNNIDTLTKNLINRINHFSSHK